MLNSDTAMAGTTAGSFTYRESWYQVESRARIIIFEVAVFEAEIGLQQRPSQLSLQAGNHANRSLNREHGGLMSWPEQFYQARQPKQSPDAKDLQPFSLSARAMQLSIFGSMVC